MHGKCDGYGFDSYPEEWVTRLSAALSSATEHKTEKCLYRNGVSLDSVPRFFLAGGQRESQNKVLPLNKQYIEFEWKAEKSVLTFDFLCTFYMRGKE